MKPIIRNLAVAAILPAVLSACGGGGGGGNNTPAPPATSASFQDKVGASFATVFNASNTSDPVDPTAASVPPLDLMGNAVDN